MASLIEKKENNQVLLTIDVSPESFNDALQQSFKKNAKKFSVPGFRKGKAPMNIVTKYYGEGVLYEDAIDIAAAPAYSEAIKEHGLEPVDRPEMDIQEINREDGLKFTVMVTVKPEVKLGTYKGVEAVRRETDITDEDVEKELKRVQERNSRLVPVEDRPIQNEDTANIDYTGYLNDEPFEGGQGSSYDLKIGSNTFIPGFEEQLIGHQAGESFDLNVTFPEDYGNEDLKGQDVVFKVTVNSIKQREVPQLDDEFAKDVSEFDTLDEYKAGLRKDLTEKAEKQNDSEFEENVIRAVTDNAEVDIPHVMVDQEIESMIDLQKNQMRQQGIELEQYLSYMGQSMDTFREQLHEPAEQRVKTQLVLEAIAKEEAMEASEEEVNAEIERMAGMYNMKAEDLKERFVSSEHSFIHDTVISQKTVKMLKDAAKPVAPPPEPEATEAEVADDEAVDEAKSVEVTAEDVDTEPDSAE